MISECRWKRADLPSNSDFRLWISDCRLKTVESESCSVAICNLKSPISLPLGSGELTVVPAVKNVDAEAEREPDDKAKPGDQRQSGHQSTTQHHRDQRKPGNEGHAEGAWPVGLPAPQKDDAHRYQNESEQGADVGKIGSIADIHQPRGNSHCEAGNPGGPVRRLVLGMDCGKQLRQKAVARH